MKTLLAALGGAAILALSGCETTTTVIHKYEGRACCPGQCCPAYGVANKRPTPPCCNMPMYGPRFEGMPQPGRGYGKAPEMNRPGPPGTERPGRPEQKEKAPPKE